MSEHRKSEPAAPQPPRRILGIDPSLRSTGYAVIERLGRKVGGVEFRAVELGTVANPPRLPASRCLVAIHDRLSEVIERCRPDHAALEAVIYAQNTATAITLGHARGAAVLACASHGLEIFEYSPRKVKSGVTGRGAGAKQQVSFMVRALLGLTENPPFDIADACAVALTHAGQNPRLGGFTAL